MWARDLFASEGAFQRTMINRRGVYDRRHNYTTEYYERLSPRKPFMFERELIESRDAGQARFRALDVGSGPFTFLGFELVSDELRGLQLEVTAVDPLARVYQEEIQRSGVVPPVWPLPLKGEEISGFFPPRSFDLVVSRNAIDHAIDPLVVIGNMVSLVKPGRFVIIEVLEREAEWQRCAPRKGRGAPLDAHRVASARTVQIALRCSSFDSQWFPWFPCSRQSDVAPMLAQHIAPSLHVVAPHSRSFLCP